MEALQKLLPKHSFGDKFAFTFTHVGLIGMFSFEAEFGRDDPFVLTSKDGII